MTSDAKIGLLLGLVFIFVIAFIINGLPNLRPQTTKGEVTLNGATTTEDFGLADAAQIAQETYTWDDLLDGAQGTEGGTTEVADAQSTQAVESTPPAPQEPQSTPTAGGPDVRSILALPNFDTILERLTSGLQQRDQVTTVTMDVPRPAAEPAAPRAAEAREPTRSAAPRKPPGQVYVVAQGETLAAVAKKVYGPEEGNRLVNVNRIYEANRDILKSPDQVIAGQKLLIPPLPKPGPGPKRPEDVLTADLFERIEGMRQTPPAAKAPEVRWYVVQDGDNLWKIAAKNLGAGPRYEEIIKLNTDLIKSKDMVLDVGMRIRLPAK